MNVYTVAQATQGLADYLNETFEEPTVAIAYDSRIKSDVFAECAAGVLAANGVKVYVNYLDKDLETDFGTVKAESFLVGEAKA